MNYLIQSVQNLFELMETHFIQIILKQYIVGSLNPSYYNDALRFIGFRDDQIISLNNDQWVFTKEFYTVINPRAYVNHFGRTLLEIYDIAVRLFHIDRIESKRFCLMNRRHGLSKHFLNYDDFVKNATQSFPQYNWETISDRESCIEESAKLFASIKFLFCALGSNSIKCIFMHPHSIIVGGISDVPERVTIAIAILHDLYISAFAVPGMAHWGSPICMNIEMAFEGMKAGLYLYKNGKWPSSARIIER